MLMRIRRPLCRIQIDRVVTMTAPSPNGSVAFTRIGIAISISIDSYRYRSLRIIVSNANNETTIRILVSSAIDEYFNHCSGRGPHKWHSYKSAPSMITVTTKIPKIDHLNLPIQIGGTPNIQRCAEDTSWRWSVAFSKISLPYYCSGVHDL